MEPVISFLKTEAVIAINLQTELPIIRQLATVDLLVRPSIQERIFALKIRLAYIFGQGSCYFPRSEQIDLMEDSLLGHDYRDVIQNVTSPITQLSLIDAALANKKITPHSTATLSGPISNRARKRSDFIVQQIVRTSPNHPANTILIVGAVKEFALAFLQLGFEVYMTDLDPDIVGVEFAGRKIMHGSNNLTLAAECDHVLVTGMTIGNGSLDPIVDVCKLSNNHLWIYAETAAYASRLLAIDYVSGVFSEPFPFYVFGNQAEIHFFRTKDV